MSLFSLSTTDPKQLEAMKGQPGGDAVSGAGKPAIKAPISSENSTLNQLLEESQKLVESNGQSGLPQIKLGIGQIRSRAQELLTASAKSRPELDSSALYMLASSGINVDQTMHNIKNIHLPASVEPTSQAMDTDWQNGMAMRKEQNIMASVEEGLRAAVKDFEDYVAQNVSVEWESQREQILEYFGLRQLNQGDSMHARSTMDKSSTMKPNISVNASSSWSGIASRKDGFSDVAAIETTGNPSLMQTRQTQYATAVSKLNNARAFGQPIDVFNCFKNALINSGTGIKMQQLNDTWTLLMKISQEIDKKDETGMILVSERAFAKSYHSSAQNSNLLSNLRRQITDGAQKFLETQFYEHLQNEIHKHAHEARVGGIPSVVNKVRGYLNLLQLTSNTTKANIEVANNTPVWALIFYLLRSGHLKEAIDYVTENDATFQKIERSFPTYLKAYASVPIKQLPQQLRDRIRNDYNQRIRFLNDGVDPYKHAIYKIIGRCELSKRSLPDILPLAEDWMWLQLTLCQEPESNNELRYDQWTLEMLQQTVLQFGPRHFNAKGNNPGPYYQFLFMTGMFERAVHYMYQFHAMDAVHFAISLAYCGLLRVKSSNADTLLVEAEKTYINFAKLIGIYTSDFREFNPETTVDYLSLICLNDDPNEKLHPEVEIAHSAIRDLLLESRNFAKLLGDVRRDGSKEPGFIQSKMRLFKLSNQDEFVRTITEQAALHADEDGRAADAVLLFHLSEAYDMVVTTINKLLGETLSSDLDSTSISQTQVPAEANLSLAASENPTQLAQNMLDLYKYNATIYSSITPKSREACGVLLSILEARKAYECKDWNRCITLIESMDVIPFESTPDIGNIRRRAQSFLTLDEDVARCIPILLVMAMESCAAQTAQLKNAAFAGVGGSQQLSDLRGRAKSSLVYAGMIQYKMPSEVYSRLTRLEMIL